MAIDVPNGYEVSRALLRREILVDYRPEAGIRIGPHFYTSDAELSDVVGGIAEIVESGEWREFEGPSGVVT